MEKYSYKLDGNYHVELDLLNRQLRQVSHDAHQWMAIPVPGIFMAPGEEPRTCVLLGYSNPDGTSLPNHLIYLFPAVALAGYPEREPKLIVQLKPGWMPALSRGLYCEDGTIKIGPMEDFLQVWVPVKRCLGLLDDSDTEGRDHGCPSGTNQSVPAEGEKSIREALHKHMLWLSQRTDMIQDAVSEDVDPMEFVEYISRMCRRRRRKEE